jgi:hypothetical protein
MRSIWVATLLTATSLAAVPVEFAGTWKVRYSGPPMTGPKTIGSMILAYTVDGDRVTGIAHIGSWPGVAPIANGKVDGGQISFTARGYLSSTTGIPTCRLEGTLSGGELVIRLSTIQNPGGPGSGGVWEYRGGKIDDGAAKAAKMEALGFLSRPRRAYPQFPDSNVADPLTPKQLADHPALDAEREDQARKLSRMVEEWEKARNNDAQAFFEGLSAPELDHLLAFYNSPLGQSLVATTPHGEAEIQTTVAQFVARQ